MRLCPQPAAALLLAALMGGCTVGPDYVAPEYAAPDRWYNAAIEGLSSGEAGLQTWWQGLEDPTLQSLIARATESNLGLREAVGRINEARALLGVTSGERLPTVDLSGGASLSENSDNGSLGAFAPPGGFDAQDLYDVGFDASWEIDAFGRIRRSIEAAGAAYEASLEDYRDVLVTLSAEIGRNYVGCRLTQTRIRLARANTMAQRATLELTRERHDAGSTSGLDVAQAESNLYGTEAQIPSLQIQLHAFMNRLAVLLGESPGSLHEELARETPLRLPEGELTAGIPADLLRQRPDIRLTERLLAAQTARIGVATADLYPRFSLSGFFAVEAGNLGDVVDSGSATWGISLPFRWRLFDRSRVRSAIDVEEARTEQAFIRYERAVLLAFEEVENALVAYSLERNRRDSLAAAVDATERAVELVKIQYREGLADFQNVLDMERFLTSQQDALALSEGQILQNLIAVYKALGGGWDPDAEVAVAPSPTG